ncbi:hypothetical protein JF780_07730 [Mycobacterium intracellulare]|uniref:C40 family peptidase n=1 Tax=Mycobacterium intracellulare TaxID=1767 RepID=UPI001CD923E8|nr:C40 family peptidase [Mycobacterium intracellulare]MCA2272421.1 hypothetical protein [Mycobacterium intracellulare]MCA2324841.1 hypothetical protein [Mycobacterium intracellulare]
MGDRAATSDGCSGNAAAIAVAALGVALLSAVLVATPAHADPIATVKARTQRMSDANLNSHQIGWYDPGEKLTLVCSTRGQAVKGFFSFNIPNGGWDNLWYKTSDNSFVADVDIETGTLKDVTADCGSHAPAPAPPPAPGGDRGAQALSWARNQMATNPNNTVQCEAFVEEAYNHAFRYPSAIAAFNDLKGRGQIHTNPDGIPAGALVFTSDPRFDQGYGHVMLSEGNGRYLTANYYQNPKIREVPLNSNDSQDKFLGWASAP